MKIELLLKSLILAFTIMLLSACGASGIEGTSDSGSKQSFSLAQLRSTTQGPVYSAQLSGSDSNGTSYSGTIALSNNAAEMQNGVMIIPQVITLTLDDGITQTIETQTDTNYTLIYSST